MSVVYASGKWLLPDNMSLLTKSLEDRGAPSPTFVDAYTERSNESDNAVAGLLPAFPNNSKELSVLVIMTGKHSLSFKLFSVKNQKILKTNRVCIHPHYFADEKHKCLLEMTLKKELSDWKEESRLDVDWVIASGALWHFLKKMNFPVLPEGTPIDCDRSGFYEHAPDSNEASKYLPWLAPLVKINIAAPKFTCFRWLTLAVSNGGKGCYYDVMKTHVKPLYFKLMPTVFTVDIGTGSVKFYYDTMPEAIETHPANLHPETMAYLIATTLIRLEKMKKENKI